MSRQAQNYFSNSNMNQMLNYVNGFNVFLTEFIKLNLQSSNLNCHHKKNMLKVNVCEKLNYEKDKS